MFIFVAVGVCKLFAGADKTLEPHIPGSRRERACHERLFGHCSGDLSRAAPQDMPLAHPCDDTDWVGRSTEEDCTYGLNARLV